MGGGSGIYSPGRGAWIVKLDMYCNTLWESFYTDWNYQYGGGRLNEQITSVVETNDGGYAALGTLGDTPEFFKFSPIASPTPTPTLTPTPSPSPSAFPNPTSTPTPSSSPSVPEFPTWTVLPGILVASIVVAVAVKRKTKIKN